MILAQIGLLLADKLNGILPTIEEILQHFLNLSILTVGLYFLLFRPIKKKIVIRQQSLKKIEEDNTALTEEVKEMKVEFDQLISKAKSEASQIHQDAVDVAAQKTNEIISEARVKAKEIIERTEKEMVKEKAKLENEIKAEISTVSLDVAEKIIEKEITQQDNDKLIEECLKNWSKNG
jgi:F-type H+-transporting ATPase subunit b